MSNINIALLSPSKNAYSETFIQQHRNYLAGNVVFYFNGNLPLENDLDGRVASDYDRTLYKIRNKLKKNKFTYDEVALIKSFKKHKIDVVVAEYGVVGTAVLDLCIFLKLPLIPIFHGYDASQYDIIERYKARYLKLFNYVNNVIAVSEKIAERLIELGCSSSKITVTPCAPDDSFFDIQPVFENKNIVGVGRFVDKKAPYYNILAFKKVLEQHPDAKLTLAGNGPLHQTCVNLVKYLSIGANVDLVGIISPKELEVIFKKSSVFVQHSIIAINGDSEGTPVAILEASAAGLPVVSTIHAGIPDVVKNNETGFLVQEHKVDEMANKISVLLDDLELAAKMGESGRLLVKNNFSKKIHIKILNNVLSNSISK